MAVGTIYKQSVKYKLSTSICTHLWYMYVGVSNMHNMVVSIYSFHSFTEQGEDVFLGQNLVCKIFTEPSKEWCKMLNNANDTLIQAMLQCYALLNIQVIKQIFVKCYKKLHNFYWHSKTIYEGILADTNC